LDSSSAASKPPGRHILLVEDHLINQKLARRILENHGYLVTCAADGMEALRACDTDRFDLILMDIQMPVMDGFEATAELRKREQQTGRHTPVVALTANAMQGDRERCLAAGMDGYITKPIKTAELFETISVAASAPNP
jgi:CheY-like chemotaxis protein